MLWYLVGHDHGIVRSVEAGSIGEARFRLAPILPNHSVLSQDSYALGREVGVTAPPRTKKGYPRKHFGPTHWGVNEIRRRVILAANVEGIPDLQIGKAVGISGEAVSQVRKKMGLPSVAQRRLMAVRAYWTLGWPDQRIAKRLGTDAPRIVEVRKRLGLKPHRTKGGMTKAQRQAIIGGDYVV